MNFVRKVANSDILASIIDIPESLRNKKVEILIFPYESMETEVNVAHKSKRARGLLEKYRNKDLQAFEDGAWAKAAVDKHENS